MQPSTPLSHSRFVPHGPGSDAPQEAQRLEIPRAQRRSLAREHGFESLLTEGRLPEGLRGTLVRNGPGLFESFGVPYPHLFEADGAPSAVRLENAGAFGAQRLVQSAELQEERVSGKPLYGSVAAWPRRLVNGLKMRTKNTANTSVMSWQGRLLGLMEAAPPTELDPTDLSTLGVTRLGDVVRGPFSAHPHRVVGRRASYNFGVSYGREVHLDIYELPDIGDARHLARLPLPRPVMLHDFIATENHLVFLVAPAEVQVWRALLGIGSFSKFFEWHPEHGTEVIVVPIDRPSEAKRFRTEAFYQWHFAGAFERSGKLLLDLVAYPDFGSFADLEQGTISEPGYYERVIVDPSEATLRRERLCSVPCEFPRIDPRYEGREFSQAWVVTARGEQTGLARIQTATGACEEYLFPKGVFASEGILVPRSTGAPEGDGWLLSLVYEESTDRSHLAVFDTRELCAGPVFRAFFDHHVPVTFHGIWIGEAAA
ncbi:MAG: carotenoid oxygenase family protein [Polyangiaceae bacterium]|nr:carotenoid oxygenase family protein [Polyangiaceae bacterium]